MSYFIESKYGYATVTEVSLPIIALPAVMMVGAGIVTPGSLTLTSAAYDPLVAFGSRLMLHLVPEASFFPDDSGVSSPLNPADYEFTGRWEDRSTYANHADDTGVAPGVPILLPQGGIACDGRRGLATASLGAWAGDFAVLLVCKLLGSGSEYRRLLETDFATGFAITQADSSIPGELSVSVAASPVAPVGLATSGFVLNEVNTVLVTRTGTTLSVSVNGGAPTTATVTGAALVDTPLFVGLYVSDPTTPSYNGIARIYEVLVVKDQTAPEAADLVSYAAARLASGVFDTPTVAYPDNSNMVTHIDYTNPSGLFTDLSHTVPAAFGDPIVSARQVDGAGIVSYASNASGNTAICHKRIVGGAGVGNLGYGGSASYIDTGVVQGPGRTVYVLGTKVTEGGILVCTSVGGETGNGFVQVFGGNLIWGESGGYTLIGVADPIENLDVRAVAFDENDTTGFANWDTATPVPDVGIGGAGGWTLRHGGVYGGTHVSRHLLSYNAIHTPTQMAEVARYMWAVLA